MYKTCSPIDSSHPKIFIQHKNRCDKCVWVPPGIPSQLLEEQPKGVGILVPKGPQKLPLLKMQLPIFTFTLILEAAAKRMHHGSTLLADFL